MHVLNSQNSKCSIAIQVFVILVGQVLAILILNHLRARTVTLADSIYDSLAGEVLQVALFFLDEEVFRKLIL